MSIVTLRKTIPSGSHNAPYTCELGEHWPEGQEFKLLDQRRQDSLRKYYNVPVGRVIVEQIGGEEVIVTIPDGRAFELLGVEQPIRAVKVGEVYRSTATGNRFKVIAANGKTCTAEALDGGRFDHGFVGDSCYGFSLPMVAMILDPPLPQVFDPAIVWA